MLPYGFLIRGGTDSQRIAVDHAAAFALCCECDLRAPTDCEAYLSAFHFGEDFRDFLQEAGSVKGFAGPCWADRLWFDIDREDDLPKALTDARRLAGFLQERFLLDDDILLLFYSGSKGFHLGLPTALWDPPPSVDFNRIARHFAEALAGAAGVTVDRGVYDRVRPFRSPNSRHPKTGRYKRRLAFAELMGLTLEAILGLAATPAPFDPPPPPGRNDRAAADWAAAARAVAEEAKGKAERQAATNGTPKVNRLTLEFIRDGAGKGDRHRHLFSAAANLAEFPDVRTLAHALLTEAALDSGLSPAAARRQIDCGLDYVGPVNATIPPPADPPATSPHSAPAVDLQAQLAVLWADAGDMAAERAAIAWEGNQNWTPETLAALGPALNFPPMGGHGNG